MPNDYLVSSLAPNCYIFLLGTIPATGGALTSLYALLAAADSATVDAFVSPILEVHIYTPTVAINWRNDSTGTALWPIPAGDEEVISCLAPLKKVFVKSNTAGTVTDALIKVYV